MSFLKKVFKKKPKAIDLSEWVEVGPPGTGSTTIHTPLEGTALVTDFEADREPKITDMEGTVWTLNYSGDLAYLSGENGEVQAQFLITDFNRWLDEAATAIPD